MTTEQEAFSLEGPFADGSIAAADFIPAGGCMPASAFLAE